MEEMSFVIIASHSKPIFNIERNNEIIPVYWSDLPFKCYAGDIPRISDNAPLVAKA